MPPWKYTRRVNVHRICTRPADAERCYSATHAPTRLAPPRLFLVTHRSVRNSKRKKGTAAGSQLLGTMLTLRLSTVLLARLDALVPKLAAGEDELPLMMSRVTRADVARLALVEGLKVLERRYAK